MFRRSILALLVFAVCAAVVVAVWLPRRRPNVLLITIDTLRADHLSAYGYRVHRTPTIDRLARQGVLFTNAFCDVTWTTPSMASVMTGRYATRHGLRSTYQRLADANVTLAEILRDHGYHTGAVIGSFPLDSIYGLDQGFDTYDDTFSEPLVVAGDDPIEHIESRLTADPVEQNKLAKSKQLNDSRRPDAEVTRVANAWLRQARPPFFLWVHYFGPHSVPDRRLPGLENLQRHVETYPEKVAAIDAPLNALLVGLLGTGYAKDTVIVFHADHGESLGEHRDVGHGRNLYEPTLRIPLIMTYAGELPAGRVVQGLARNVDIVPTILDLLGIRGEQAMDGSSLLPAITGEPAPVELYAETEMPRHAGFAERVAQPGREPMLVGVVRRALRTERWKLVTTTAAPMLDRPDLPFDPSVYPPQEELYDLTNDAAETHDVLAAQPAVAADLRARLRRYEEQERPTGPTLPADREAVQERLRALGYEE